VTAYCPCRRCCGRFADGRTSTDTTAWRPGIAADPTVLPYGTVVEVPGYGTHPVDDTGGAMRRHWRRDGILHIDVRMTYHWQARQWGRREMDITLLAPAE
jgi:3D (Asp-Asp-Asp) domain-containing protein